MTESTAPMQTDIEAVEALSLLHEILQQLGRLREQAQAQKNSLGQASELQIKAILINRRKTIQILDEYQTALQPILAVLRSTNIASEDRQHIRQTLAEVQQLIEDITSIDRDSIAEMKKMQQTAQTELVRIKRGNAALAAYGHITNKQNLFTDQAG